MTEHNSFWDCFEKETYKQRTYRKVPDWDETDTLHIKVYECEKCGAKFVCEIFNQGTDWVDHNWYGLKDTATVESVLSDYGL